MNRLLSAMCVSLLALPVMADGLRCTDMPRNKWMPEENAIALLKQQGYKLKSIDFEPYCYEVEAWDRDGRRVELKLDPVSGRVMKTRFDR